MGIRDVEGRTACSFHITRRCPMAVETQNSLDEISKLVEEQIEAAPDSDSSDKEQEEEAPEQTDQNS
jgi:hypothetical protein